VHTEIYEWFNIAFDKWGRTPTAEQTKIAQDIFLKLMKNGYLEEKTTKQPYCEKHSSFLADRFIEGTCPICQYEDARGDQCDKCGNLLDPTQLINPRCKVDGATPVVRETKHVYILLDKLSPAIDEWAQKAMVDGGWSNNGVGITKSWIDKGLNPRAITRDLKWGTAVPLDGYEKKVMYVWFDACIGYPSITATYTEEWEKWWKNPEHVQLYQFMGKDNVPFHSVVFPGSQIGTEENWTKVHNISTTEYLTYEGGKFSKSRNTGVFGDSARSTGVPSDIYRYYLLSRRPETNDTDFEWKSLIDANNNELKNNLGNLCNRVVVFIQKKYDSTLPDYTKHTTTELTEWIAEVNTLLAEYNENFTAVKIKAALATAMRIAAQGNKLLQSNTLDNKTFESEPDKIAAVLGLAVNLLVLLVAVFRPFTPVTSTNIAAQLGLDKGESIEIPDTWTGDYIKPGHKLGEPARLFEPIKPEMEHVWRDQFGGEEVRKAKEEKAAKAEKKRLDKLKKKEKKAAGTTAPAGDAAAPIHGDTAKVADGAAISPPATGAGGAAKGTAADDKQVQELAKKVEDLRS
jgi:methionyl-tRNA synthetase